MLQLWDKHLTANTQFHDHSCPGCTIPAAQLPEPEVWNRSGSLPTEPIQKILHGTWQIIEIHAGVQTTGFQNVYINKVQKSILMQLANEQSTNDTVSSSSSTQQQRFGLRKGHPYNLSQTPIQVWLNCPVSLGMHGMNGLADLLQMQVELTYQNSPASFSQLRWYFSFS